MFGASISPVFLQSIWPVKSCHLPGDLLTTIRVGDLSSISLEPGLQITFYSCSKRKLFSEQTGWFLPSEVLTCRSEMQHMWKIDRMKCKPKPARIGLWICREGNLVCSWILGLYPNYQSVLLTWIAGSDLRLVHITTPPQKWKPYTISSSLSDEIVKV